MQNVFLRGMQSVAVQGWMKNMENMIQKKSSMILRPSFKPQVVPGPQVPDFQGMIDEDFTPGPGPAVYPHTAFDTEKKKKREKFRKPMGAPARRPKKVRSEQKKKKTRRKKKSPKSLVKKKSSNSRRQVFSLLALFGRLDKDESGRLTKSEVRKLAKSLSRTKYEGLLIIIDRNKDNSIDFKEFAKYMRSRGVTADN